MCLLVIVDNYLCGHKVRRSHGIPPDEFIRECDDSVNMLDCALNCNEEAVPWLCPDCHWEYVRENFVPLWQQTTIAKCRILQQSEMYPAEPEYRMSQTVVEHLESTFEAQQQAITNSAIAYHKLRDKTLQCFLGEHFRIFMMEANQAHRTWSMSHTRDPFARVRSDTDVKHKSSSASDSDSDDSLDDHLGPPDIENDPGFAHEIATIQEAIRMQTGLALPFRSASTVSNSDSPAVEAGGEELECLWCENHGRSMGVTTSQRICDECLQLGSRQIVAYVREMADAAGGYADVVPEHPSGGARGNRTPRNRQRQPEAPTTVGLSIEALNSIPRSHRAAAQAFFVIEPPAAARRDRSNNAEDGGWRPGSFEFSLHTPSRQASRINRNRHPSAPGAASPRYAQTLPDFNFNDPPQQQRRRGPRSGAAFPPHAQNLPGLIFNGPPQQQRQHRPRSELAVFPPRVPEYNLDGAAQPRRRLNQKKSEEDIDYDGIE